MNNCGDSYVVRIYRRDENNPENVVGLVEIVGSRTEHFSGKEDLWAILSTPDKIKSSSSRRE